MSITVKRNKLPLHLTLHSDYLNVICKGVEDVPVPYKQFTIKHDSSLKIIEQFFKTVQFLLLTHIDTVIYDVCYMLKERKDIENSPEIPDF